MSEATNAPELPGQTNEPTLGHQLLRASAGTGKTYQLVEAYVDALMVHKLTPADIVVITFTRKAAGELRRRIAARLQQLHADAATLAALEDAPIDTFHGLCLRLLAERNYASGDGNAPLPILGEADAAQRLFVEAAHAVWFGADAELAKHVSALAPWWAIGGGAAQTLWLALSRAREDGLPLDASLWQQPEDAQAAQQAAHARLLDFRQRLVDAAPTLSTPASKAKLQAFAAAAVPAPQSPWPSWQAGWRAALALVDRRGRFGSVIAVGEKEELLLDVDGVAASACAARLHPSCQALAQAAWRAYQAAKKASGVQDFSDLIEAVVQQLRAEQQRARAQNETLVPRFAAILVDEAQDTNAQQRQLVQLLAGVAEDGRTAAASLLVVGDWKQSIYTFRGADADNFARFATDVQQLGGQQRTLAHSYRSAPDLLQAINSLGTALFADTYEALEPSDKVRAAYPAYAATDGTLQATQTAGFFWQPIDCVAGQAGHNMQQEAEATAETVAQAIADGVAPSDIAILLAQLRAWAPLFAQSLRARGIAVATGGGGNLLQQAEVRDMLATLAWSTDAQQSLEAAISLRSPHFGLSDDALYALFGPAGTAAGAAAALHAGDAAPALAVLQQQFASAVTTGAADAQSQQRAARSLAHAAAQMAILVPQVQHAGPWEALVAIEEAFNVRALACAAQQPAQKLANLDRLLQMAERAQRRDATGAATFAADLLFALAQDSSVAGEAPLAAAPGEAVTLTSVHRSKGLQYRYVILPGLDRQGRADHAQALYVRGHGIVFAPRRGRETLRSKRFRAAQASAQEQTAAERRRLLYVAVTRARQRVIFVGPPPQACSNHGFAALLAPWSQQADVPLCVLPPLPPQATAPRTAPPEPPPPQAACAAPAFRHAAPTQALFRTSVTALALEAAAGADGALDAAPNLHVAADTDPRACAQDRYKERSARAQGELVHAILAAWERHSQHDSLAGFIEAELAHAGVGLQSATAIAIRSDLLAWLQSPAGKWFQKLAPQQRRVELPFALRASNASVCAELVGRIDLLVWENDAPVVVDFKHAFVRGEQSAYHHQLAAYAWAAGRLCDYVGPVQARLMYLRSTTQPAVVVIDASAAQAVEQRLLAWAGAQQKGMA